MTASVDAARGETASKRAGLSSFALTLAVVILVYQKHVPEPLGLPWIKDHLDYALWILGAILAGELVRQSGTGLRKLYRWLKEGVSVVIRVGPDRGKNDRGS